MKDIHAALAGALLALAACAAPTPEPPEAPRPLHPMLAVDGLRITAGPIAEGDPRWIVGVDVDAWNTEGWTIGALRVTAVADGTAELTLLDQAPHTTLRGALARPMLDGASLLARIRRVDVDRVELDQGAEAGLGVGERGVVIDADGRAVGGVEVTAVEGHRGFARVDDGAKAMASGQEVRWLEADRGGVGPARIRVLVVESGHALTDALERRAAGWSGLEFTTAAGGDVSEGAARALGAQRGADLVVYGSARCDGRGCQTPALMPITGPLVEAMGPRCEPPDPWCVALGPDVARGPAPPADAVADRVLGHLAARTRRPQRAVWHLRRALRRGGYGPAQRPWAHLELAHQGVASGHWSRARADIASAAIAVGGEPARLAVERARVSLAHHASAWREAETRAAALVGRARAAGDPLTEVFGHRTLGFVVPDLASARRHFAAAAEVSRTVGHDLGYADAMAGLAKRLHEAGWPDEALAVLTDEVLPLYAEPPTARHRAHALTYVARIHRGRGDYDAALRLLRETIIPAHARRGDRLDVAAATGDVADVLRARGELDAAERMLIEQVLPALRDVGPEGGEACWVELLGSIALERDDWAEARRWFGQAAATYANRGAEVGYARLRLAQAMAASSVGDYRMARSLRSAAWPILDAHGLDDDVLIARLGLAHSLAMTHEYRAAESLLRGRVLPAYEERGDDLRIGEAWGVLGIIEALRGDMDAAVRIFRERQLPAYAAANAHLVWAEEAAGLADLLAGRGELDEAVALRTDAALAAARASPARQVEHHIALAGLLVRRDGPGDRAAARVALGDARRLAGEEPAMAAGVDAAMKAHGL